MTPGTGIATGTDVYATEKIVENALKGSKISSLALDNRRRKAYHLRIGEHDMTDAAVESQPVTASPNPTFPQQIEVTFTLKLTVDSQAERDCWLEAGTTNATLDAAADIMDMLCDWAPALESVNGLTYTQIQQAFAKRDI
jgi:hypothetical protein